MTDKSVSNMDKIISKNPATGEPLKEFAVTPLSDMPVIFDRARQAQQAWAQLSVKKRCRKLLDLREVLVDRMDEIVEIISAENGKPKVEALAHDLYGMTNLLGYFGKKGPSLLGDQPLSISNPILLHKKSYLNYYPMGVIAVISPWNFPFLLPFGEIAMAMAAGNAVVFKPSEIVPQIGLKIQELVEEAGFPKNLLQTVIGAGNAGAAIIDEKPDKIFFTGSVATGKKIMAAAAKTLTPVSLELGGKDPTIVLADADPDFAASAITFGALANSGQMCASTERVIIHEKIADKVIAKTKEKFEELRHGNASENDIDVDLSVITFEKQKATYEEHLKEAKEKGATIVTGGDFSSDKTYLEPTIVTGNNVEDLKVYNEETFGPVIAITTFKTVEEAVEKANRSNYGLTASVISKSNSRAEEIGKLIETGIVTVNEAPYTAAVPETPWGGVKESGIGRKHSDHGLLEFVHTRHINRPRWSAAIIKSPWWFPYTKYQYETFRYVIQMARRSWLRKAVALPMLLWNFLMFVKKEKRL